MKKLLFVICFLSIQNFTICQPVREGMDVNQFYRFADFHIHPTYKHYFRLSINEMKEILRGSKYDEQKNTITFDPGLVEYFKNKNWEKYENRYKKKNEKALRSGLTSTLRNYDQAGYSQIMYTPGSILCNSYSPYEKQFALKFMKRIISSFLVTGIRLPRLNAYSKDDHTPFDDFRAEYYYNLLQEEEKLVETSLPDFPFKNDGQTYQLTRPYFNRIKMIKNSEELLDCIRQNDQVFKTWKNGDAPPHIVTPMVMSIEGGQVLYDTLSANYKYILNPLNFHGHSKFWRGIDQSTLDRIDDELFNSVHKLRNLPHRLFFITLGHFAQNHVVGFAKTLDRDPENFQHRAMSSITKIPTVRNNIIRKTYAGFNYRDNIGLRIVDSFLNPAGSRFGKPTYIDVKHMDIQARIQYYYARRDLEKKYNIKIPVIASHFAVSGENQAMAAATGLWPNFDRYIETEDIKDYYKTQILREGMSKSRADYWKNEIMLSDDTSDKNDTMTAFEKAMYRPLNFLENPTLTNEVFDPFTEFDRTPIDSNKNIGWFYPWSINLFDEEIIEINKSDGIIGLLLDPRQQGAYMVNYKSYFTEIKNKFNTEIQDSAVRAAIIQYQFKKGEINPVDYCKSEPLLRNIFYIVRLISQEKDAENNPSNTIKYPWFVKDSLKLQNDPWDFISIGSDYDGLIDPVDFAPTASYVPFLHKSFIIYAYIFSKIHRDEFFDPETGMPLVTSIHDSETKMGKFFYENGKNFILKYF